MAMSKLRGRVAKEAEEDTASSETLIYSFKRSVKLSSVCASHIHPYVGAYFHP